MKEEWEPKLKHYPHFDAPLPYAEVMKLVKDPVRVAQNTFFPFLLYYDVQEKFGRQKPKERPIRYASRRDSYIYSYYRHLLSFEYEAKLKAENLDEQVIAYRKIPVTSGVKGGKCNIHFAKDAFQEIKNRGDCFAVALDISDYFNNIDHERLKHLWCELMGFKELPSDHEAVFHNITQHKWVDFDKACTILGYMGEVEISGVKKFGFKRNISRESFFKDKKYKQLCSMKEFREKIVPKIEKNKKDHGIPQGSPISDLLANLFLFPFDKTMQAYSEKHSIYYRRYSDDILLIMPRNEGLLLKTIELVKKELNKAGSQLSIKDKKTTIKEFHKDGVNLHCSPYFVKSLDKKDQHSGNHFEYLGFSFDGKTVRIKDGTMQRFERKMLYAARREASKLAARYIDKTPKEISELAKFELLYQKYGNVQDYENLDFSSLEDKKKLTFLVYAKKADEVFKDFKSDIMQQVSGHKKKLREMLNNEIVEQWKKRKAKQQDAA